jgi:hypothetical protein
MNLLIHFIYSASPHVIAGVLAPDDFSLYGILRPLEMPPLKDALPSIKRKPSAQMAAAAKRSNFGGAAAAAASGGSGGDGDHRPSSPGSALQRTPHSQLQYPSYRPYFAVVCVSTAPQGRRAAAPKLSLVHSQHIDIRPQNRTT